MQDDTEPPEGECEDAEFEIETSYQQHVVQFREFAAKTDEWLNHYEQVMSPMIIKCLIGREESIGTADWQLLNALTHHAERFAKLVQSGLAEYEEAYKTARAIFDKGI